MCIICIYAWICLFSLIHPYIHKERDVCMYTSMQAAQQEKLKNKEAENSELRKEKKKVESEMQKLKADLSKKEIKLKEFEKENCDFEGGPSGLRTQDDPAARIEVTLSREPAATKQHLLTPLPSQPGFATPYEQPNPSNLISHPIAPFYPTPFCIIHRRPLLRLLLSPLLLGWIDKATVQPETRTFHIISTIPG